MIILMSYFLYFQVLTTSSEAILLVILALNGYVAKPLNLDLYKLNTESKEGQRMVVTDLRQLNEHLNKTVPVAFRGKDNPENYFRSHNSSFTYEENLLRLLTKTLTTFEGRIKRAINPSCPVNWVIDFQSTRYPSHIWKAVCNGQGTSCLSAQSNQPACEENTISWSVLMFLGINQNGHQIWQWQEESIPIGCSCSDL